MSEHASFEDKMLQGTLFELPHDDPLPNLCEYARPFAKDCEELVAEVEKRLNEMTVNVGLLQLQRKYFLWYETAPPSHRRHVGSGASHTCIHQVYLHYYRILDRERIALNPPLLRPPAPSTAPTMLEGTILGLAE